MLGVDPLGTVPLGAGSDMSIDATGTLMILPAASDVDPAVELGESERTHVQRWEFVNEMTATTFGGWLGGTLGRTPDAALLGGVVGWLGYRWITRRDEP